MKLLLNKEKIKNREISRPGIKICIQKLMKINFRDKIKIKEHFKMIRIAFHS
jgi:hypothetical protein